MTAPPTLFLVHGAHSFALRSRALAIGRLPECDVVLDGWEISRRHARVVPTTAGPLLVDRSRFGTFVNNLQVIAPLLLAEGDVIRIGTTELQVLKTLPPELTPSPQPAQQSRLTRWWKRYGWSEVVSSVAALVGALGTLRAGGGIAAAAVAGTVTEIVWFYASLAVRDLRYEARERRSAGRPFDFAAIRDVLRNLTREVDAADAVDLVIRPLCIGAGIALFGGALGVLAGKLSADLLFYGPILKVLHWRLAKRVPLPIEPERLRQTGRIDLPVGPLASLHRRLDTEASTQPAPRPPTLHTD
ncbi:MAG TPA: FHA domain-containing protein [Gemmatimonadales bacterium]